ncbi:MAG TPA: response regulator [Gemmatimonadales bacterium]|nr:response regulator [Gemmatimonadales bacterium]
MGSEAKRVLVVEDDPEVRRVLVRMLGRHGYHVSEAPEGRAALEAVTENPTDVVLTDLTLPDMNGVELIIALRAAYPRLPVVAMSGDLQTRTPLAEVAPDLADVITLRKPFTMAQVTEALHRALSEEDRAMA